MALPSSFDKVMVEDTWVLGWRREADRLIFVVEASLWPGHPAYELPKKGEWTCYKRGQLLFEGVRRIEGLLDQDAVSFNTDPDGSRDYGSIGYLDTATDGFRINGDFGDVAVQAVGVRLELE
jgi:hypothetical protein